MKRLLNKIFLTLVTGACLSSCGDDFLSTKPSDKLSDEVVFESLDKAQLVLTGAYDWLTNGWLAHYSNQYIFFYPDVMADDAYVSPVGNYGRFVPAYQYTVDPSSTYSRDPWRGLYSLIDNVNSILDNIDKLPAGEENDRIKGEALALRAYSYHFLVRVYAKPVNKHPDSPGVILRLQSSTTPLPRATVKAVYDQMVSDLGTAIGLLKNSTSKACIDKRGAQALLARVYLDLGNEVDGIKVANEALSGLSLMNKSEYASKFCEVNSESIWAFECPTDDSQAYLSLPAFWYFADGYNEDTKQYSNVVDGYSSLRVSQNLYKLIESKDDARNAFFPLTNKNNLVRYNGGVLTTKISSRKGSSMGVGSFNMLRGSELYLIIAELAADKAHYPVARTALNTLRKDRGLTDYEGQDNELADEIQKERRIELFAEGHRLFDLKRRNLPLKRTGVEGHNLWNTQLDLPAGSDKFELPIPQEEIDANEALTASDQNPAYK